MGRPKIIEKFWFCKLRLTLPENSNETTYKSYVKALTEFCCGEGLQAQLNPHTIGVENGWVTGKPHIHLHMRTTHSDSNLRKTIIPKCLSFLKDSRKVDNSVYSIKCHKEEDIDSLDRFFRYPLKECGLQYRDFCCFPNNWTEQEIEYSARLAQDEAANKKRDIEKTEEREAAKEAKKSEFDDYIIKLHNEKPFKDLHTLHVEVMRYFAEESHGINPNHSWSKTLFFGVKFNLTSLEEISRIKMQKEGFL